MIVDTPDGPKFEWEVDEASLAAALAATAAAAEQSQARADARKRQAASKSGVVDLVGLAQRGDVESVKELLSAGCTADVVAFELDLFPGSKRMFCNDWTPLTMAAAIGDGAMVAALLEARACVNAQCRSTTSSGSFRYWTALDCARTGGAIPFERDPDKAQQPRHPLAERLLLEAGALPSSALPEPAEVNTFGRPAEAGQRANPCLDAAGKPLRPEHLYDKDEEEERRRVPGAPMLGRGGSGCPTTSIGQDLATMSLGTKAPQDLLLAGGAAYC